MLCLQHGRRDDLGIALPPCVVGGSPLSFCHIVTQLSFDFLLEYGKWIVWFSLFSWLLIVTSYCVILNNVILFAFLFICVRIELTRKRTIWQA